ncbi:MAG: hypothetical protein DSZ23_04515 [Thermodesulfatator sp.]|nr:MAG: hypothetical protein DSZ23_04515 [Thermodesulfatator sp.]
MSFFAHNNGRARVLADGQYFPGGYLRIFQHGQGHLTIIGGGQWIMQNLGYGFVMLPPQKIGNFMHKEQKIALLIDCDNVSYKSIEGVIDELSKYGKVHIRNAYGNWKNETMKGWEEKLHPHAIRPVQQFAYTKGKNATDAARAAADIILTAPGLSVINAAMEQARITFERMKSYTVYRIAETIRVLLFMTLSILIFKFYPITAVMIVLLALLNDIPILSIAYDNTRIQQEPVRWNMKELIMVSSILGIAGVMSSFLIFFLLKEMQLPEPMIQSMLFVKLIVAGHTTIFVTRTEDWLWKRPFPSWILVQSSFWSALAGTMIGVYGWWIEPIGWQYAGYMWAYALAWGLFNDAVKKGAFALLRRKGLYA